MARETLQTYINIIPEERENGMIPADSGGVTLYDQAKRCGTRAAIASPLLPTACSQEDPGNALKAVFCAAVAVGGVKLVGKMISWSVDSNERARERRDHEEYKRAQRDLEDIHYLEKSDRADQKEFDAIAKRIRKR